MTQSYAMLAALYDELGMADFARTNVPLMLEYAQRNDWLGRQITELGCGTGEGILTLSDSGYTVTGIDMSQEMLEVAQTKSSTVEWIQEDIREMTDSIGPQDLIVAVDVMNEMDNVRELQAIFGGVLERLRDGRLFMFDMYTIAGLTGRGTSDDRIVYDQNGVTMFSSNRYDYERQASTRNHITFVRDATSGEWNRMDTSRVLRAYPLQAIATLLQRTGFSAVTLLNEYFGRVDDPGSVDRVIFIATK